MKYPNLIGVVATLFAIVGVGTASAADLPMKAPAPMPPVVPPFSWTGFYIGGSAGAGVLFDAGYPTSSNTLLADRHGIGALAGGQLGYNWQTGMLVLGIEGDGFWSGMRVNQDTFSGINNGLLVSTATIKNKYDYDVAARIGVAFDRALVYGKAGWVAGAFDWNTTVVDNPGYINTAGATLDGLLIGLGLEYAFTNNWTIKFEYDYLGFGSKDVVFTTITSAGATPFNTTQSVSADKHIFKIGFNYLFNAAPLVARY